MWHRKCSHQERPNDFIVKRIGVPKRILIIDDQPHVLDALREIVAAFQHKHPYEITTARSVDEAVAILQRQRFHLILLDMIMPGIGNPLLRRQGLDLLKRIRDLGVDAPVLMMSGDLDPQKEAEALREGAFAYLQKPFNLRELDRLIARALASVDPC
jgi:DNA-binding NtrC family response regulator